jgi:hypothetical protein
MDVRQSQQPSRLAEQSASRPAATSHHGKVEFGPVKLLVMLWIALSIIALVGIGYRTMGAVTSDVKSNEYQVVFLSNDQFYFGKLTRVNAQTMKLTDIYYLQVQQQVQPSTTSTTSTTPQQVQLVKLGNELHGPEDAMYINRQSVLFWENLKNDGKVAKAIAADKAKK